MNEARRGVAKLGGVLAPEQKQTKANKLNDELATILDFNMLQKLKLLLLLY